MWLMGVAWAVHSTAAWQGGDGCAGACDLCTSARRVPWRGDMGRVFHSLLFYNIFRDNVRALRGLGKCALLSRGQEVTAGTALLTSQEPLPCSQKMRGCVRG